MWSGLGVVRGRCSQAAAQLAHNHQRRGNVVPGDREIVGQVESAGPWPVGTVMTTGDQPVRSVGIQGAHVAVERAPASPQL